MTCEGCGTPIQSAPRGRRRWCSDCKAQRNRDRASTWAQENRERRRIYLRDYNRRNAERLAVQKRNWRERNLEKATEIARRNYEANREQRIAAAREWVKQNPEAARAARKATKRNRRARKALAEGRHSQAEFLAVCELVAWRCAYCAEQLTEQTATRDHIIPLVRGGSDSIDNITPACLDCNRRKGRRTADEFALEMSL